MHTASCQALCCHIDIEALIVVTVIFLFLPTERRQQGKFQPFRRLFGKRKKRETGRNLGAVELKDHFSTGEVCNGVVSVNEDILR
jgi:hypothetical protein